MNGFQGFRWLELLGLHAVQVSGQGAVFSVSSSPLLHLPPHTILHKLYTATYTQCKRSTLPLQPLAIVKYKRNINLQQFRYTGGLSQ